MQQLNIQGKTKEQEAIEFIRFHEPEEGYFLGFSGGKDSVVLYNIALKSGVKFFPYYSLMPDPPQLIRFIRKNYPEVTIIKPERNFYQQVETWFPPHRHSRWCCDYIKEGPSKKIPLAHRLIGVRAEESNSRAKRGWINKFTKKRINYHPLFDWREWEIWDYIEENKLPYCSLYDEGFARLGCMMCPMRSVAELDKYRKRWPNHFRLFEKSCYLWWERTGHHRQAIRGYARLFDEFMDNWYRGK